MHELLEAHHILIELHPLVHLAFLDIAHDVINRLEADRVKRSGAVALWIQRLESWGEYASVTIAIDEAVQRVAVAANGRIFLDTPFIFQQRRRPDADGAPLSPLAKGLLNVLDFQSHVLHAIAVD